MFEIFLLIAAGVAIWYYWGDIKAMIPGLTAIPIIDNDPVENPVPVEPKPEDPEGPKA